MPKTRKNRGGAPRVPPGTKYDNKGRIIRLGPTPPTTPPPPTTPSPPPLARRRGYNRSAQPDADMRGSQPTTPPDLRTAIAALPTRSQAPVSQTSSTGEGSRKNKKRRKSRKNKKRRKNKKSRKSKKPSRKAGCWPFGSCTSRPGKYQKPKGKKTTHTHRRKLSPSPRPSDKTQGKRGTRRYSPIREKV